MSSNHLDEHRLRRLLEVGRSLLSELDLEVVLERVLDVARELTDARYAALRIVDASRDAEPERFIVSGLDTEAGRTTAESPNGRAIIGELSRGSTPLPGSNGSLGPAASATFLGASIATRGETYGDLYVTEKHRGSFTQGDDQALVVLAEWAAIAIANARLYVGLERQRTDLEHAVSGLEATTTIAKAVGDETDLNRVLKLIVRRARTLVEARTVLILLEEDGNLCLAATAGQSRAPPSELCLPIKGSLPGAVLKKGRPVRLADAPSTLRLGLGDFTGDAKTAMLVPLRFRGRSSGLLMAFDRLTEGPEFDAEDERLLLAFAASAGTAVATAQTVGANRLRDIVRAAEAERVRWARELHDETLQGLGALQILLTTGRRRRGGVEEAADRAIAHVDDEIAKLQALITELRPAALDEIGLGAAITALMERAQVAHVAEVELELDLDHDEGRASTRLEPDVENTVFRLVQEALTNVGKHAGARHVGVSVVEADGTITATVTDDGVGFDPKSRSQGFGLVGMRERLSLVGGGIEIRSAPGEGTSVFATVPAHRAEALVARGLAPGPPLSGR